jgi:hypothetical protein
MQRVVKSANVAVIGTNGPHGPHLAPVWFLYRDGAFQFVTSVGRRKARNIQADYRVGVAIMADGGKPAVMVDATARLTTEDAVPLITELATANLGADEGAAYVERLLASLSPDQLWRIVVTPTWWKGWGLDDAAATHREVVAPGDTTKRS